MDGSGDRPSRVPDAVWHGLAKVAMFVLEVSLGAQRHAVRMAMRMGLTADRLRESPGERSQKRRRSLYRAAIEAENVDRASRALIGAYRNPGSSPPGDEVPKLIDPKADSFEEEVYADYIKGQRGLPIVRRMLQERVDAIAPTAVVLALITLFCGTMAWTLGGGMSWWAAVPPAVYVLAMSLDAYLLKRRIDAGIYGGNEFEAREIARYILEDDISRGDGDGTRRAVRVFDDPWHAETRTPLRAGVQGA